jgi:hypothetical protein
LLIPLALILLFCGIFLIERAIANPLIYDVDSILFGSVTLACGLFLASYLLRSIRLLPVPGAEQGNLQNERPPALAKARRAALPAKTPPTPRPFHRFYVDDTHISL